MFNIIYTTDLHGSEEHYNNVFNFAIANKVNIIHLGADLLPKGSSILEKQKKFIRGFLKNFYRKCTDKGIQVLAFFGNDDVYSRKPYFREYASLLDEKPIEFEGHIFKAYGFVLDYPFGLKTACKINHQGWTCPDSYIGDPVDIGPTGGFEKIENVKEYFLKKGTIEDDLKNIHVNDKTIIAIHQPPWAINLDVCCDGRRVGSEAVYDFIKEKQPKICLCGHIHENYDLTREWSAYIGKTLVVQPGQHREKTYLTVIDIHDCQAHHVIIPH